MKASILGSKHKMGIWSLAIAFALVGSAHANLIVNGSFEDGNFAPKTSDSGTMQLFDGSTAITGWVVNGGGGGAGGDIAWEQSSTQPNGNPWGFVASDGAKFLDLTGYVNDGNNPHGGISLTQTVNTVIGTTYFLSFDVGSSELYTHGVNPQIQVSVNGTPPTYVFTGNNTTLPDSLPYNDHWQETGFEFVAGGTNATLSFLATTPGSDNVILLDNVSLTAVPEPATVLAGMLLLLPLGTSAYRIIRNSRTTAV